MEFFCEVVVSFNMFKFYKVTEETLQWNRPFVFAKNVGIVGIVCHTKRGKS